jgi:MFS family permease
VVTAPAVGPTLGGWLTDSYSWHWCFLINLPVGMLSLAMVQLFIVEPEALKQDRKRMLAGGLRVDYVGFALVALGFGALQIMLDRYELDDGFSSGFISGLGLIAGLSLLTLVVWEMFHPQPAMNVRLWRSSAFAISCVVMFLFGFMLISMTQLIPQLTQTLFGYDATLSGFTLGLGGRHRHRSVRSTEMADPDVACRHGLGAVVERVAQSRHIVLGYIAGARDAGDLAAVPVHSAECGVVCWGSAEPHERGVGDDQSYAQPGRQCRRVVHHHNAGATTAVPS